MMDWLFDKTYGLDQMLMVWFGGFALGYALASRQRITDDIAMRAMELKIKRLEEQIDE